MAFPQPFVEDKADLMFSSDSLHTSQLSPARTLQQMCHRETTRIGRPWNWHSDRQSRQRVAGLGTAAAQACPDLEDGGSVGVNGGVHHALPLLDALAAVLLKGGVPLLLGRQLELLTLLDQAEVLLHSHTCLGAVVSL